MQELAATPIKYQSLRRFPTSTFDLSVVAGPRALIADVLSAIRQLAGETLVQAEFLRDFTLPTGDRSLSYRLTVGAAARAPFS